MEEKCYLILLWTCRCCVCLITWSRHSEITRNRLFLHIFAQFSKGGKKKKTTKEEEAEEEEDIEEHCRKSNRLKESEKRKQVLTTLNEPFCVYKLPGHNVFKPLKRIPHPSMAVDCHTLQIDDVLHMWPHHEQNRWSNWSNVQATSRKHPFP